MIMIKPQSFQAKVAEHIELNKKYHSLRLELVEPHQLEFTAGQYISVAIGLPAQAGGGDPASAGQVRLNRRTQAGAFIQIAEIRRF